MKTKEQKKQAIGDAQKLIDESRNLFFVDFTGTGVEDMKVLRRSLKDFGAKTKVIKKKLLRVALEKEKVDFNPEQFDEQLATIFFSKDISEVAGPIYKFYKDKEKKGFKILGAYDLVNKNFLDEAMVKRIGQLPSREILLAQLVGMLSMPVKMFMNVLDKRSQKLAEVK